MKFEDESEIRIRDESELESEISEIQYEIRVSEVSIWATVEF